MSDDSELSKAEIAGISRFISNKIKPCECGGGKWMLARHVYELVQLRGDTCRGIVPVVCDACGRMLLFDAIQVGISRS